MLAKVSMGQLREHFFFKSKLITRKFGGRVGGGGWGRGNEYAFKESNSAIFISASPPYGDQL